MKSQKSLTVTCYRLLVLSQGECVQLSRMARKFLRSFQNLRVLSTKQAYKEKIEWLRGNLYKIRS
ncbi:hypothetical protein EMIT091MI3_90100 [Kosakonia quasisacchari]